jgi:putative PIN family toxin of toxin-antitoxin system
MYPDSLPGKIVKAWRGAQFEVAISLHQLKEIGRVLAYPKINRVLQWDQKATESFLKQLMVRMELVELEDSVPKVQRDPSDAPILATLEAANADLLVTGDSDLLALRDDFPILKPTDFVQKL